MPTSFTKELRPSGGDYTSLASWQSDDGGATSKDLVTNDENVILECYKGDYSSVGGGTNYIDESLVLSGWTTDSKRNIEINCPSTEKHDGTPESGFWWQSNDGSSATFQSTGTDHVLLNDMDIDSTHTVSWRHCLLFFPTQLITFWQAAALFAQAAAVLIIAPLLACVVPYRPAPVFLYKTRPHRDRGFCKRVILQTPNLIAAQSWAGNMPSLIPIRVQATHW